MKTQFRTLFLSILFFSSITFIAGVKAGVTEEIPVTVNSGIREVTVYPQGALVSREASIRTAAGAQTLQFKLFASGISWESLRVKGTGEFTIISVDHFTDYLTEKDLPADLTGLQDQAERLKLDIEKKKAEMNALEQEENLLYANKNVGGQNTGVDPVAIKTMLELYRTRLKEIKWARLDIAQEVEKVQQRLNELNRQIGSRRQMLSTPVAKVNVRVEAARAGTGTLRVSYFVQNAGWHPEYDIRVEDISKAPVMVQKATIFQNSGEEWKDVKLTLSTSVPQRNATKPVLYSWFLNIFQPRPHYDKSTAPSRAMGGKAVQRDMAAPEMNAEAGYAPVDISYTQIAKQYKPATPFSIPSDGKPHNITLDRNTLKADYRYAAVPKLRPEAFLLARVTGWEDYDIIPGSAQIFFADEFVGTTHIAPTAGDTLEISLGTDPSVVVERKPVKAVTGQKLLGSKTVVTRAYEIVVKNAKRQTVNIVVEDQIPVSQNEQINVSLKESSGAEYNKETGKLQWKLELQPGASVTLRYGFEVTHPKDVQVPL